MTYSDGQSDEELEGRGGPSPALIGLIVLVALAIVFVVQNRERAEINFLFFEFNNRVWTVIAISLVLGILLDRLLLMWWRRRREE